MKNLRNWQRECIDRALKSYSAEQRHFLTIATPGAGKTTMAATLAKALLEADQIDLIICFAPSISVSTSFSNELSHQIGRPMNGQLGAAGQVITYQALSFLTDQFWELMKTQRVFAIFDEIHHCGGRHATQANRWGQQIINYIESSAEFSLALSGTPWRSDGLPVTLANYCPLNGELQCDYLYSLKQAIQDSVCRIPQIIALDNNRLRCTQSDGTTTDHNTIAALLKEHPIPFQQLLNTKPLVKYLIKQACFKLSEIREKNPQAAGLVVASSISHARRLQALLRDEFNEDATIVTHDSPNAHQILDKFQQGKEKWIVSVGMISEGTNIPRLQVCCYLSRIRTELYFRQVLGRIIRNDGSTHPYCYFYTLAEPTLLEYAGRLADDLPTEHTILKTEYFNSDHTASSDDPASIIQLINKDGPIIDHEYLIRTTERQQLENITTPGDSIHPKTEGELGVVGAFIEQLIEIERTFRHSLPEPGY